MKVLLIQPPTNPKVVYSVSPYHMEPLGLEYVGANLASGHEVKILDMRIEKEIDPVFESFAPELVGFTCTSVNATTVKALARRVKRASDEVTIMVGGPHAQVAPQDFRDGSVDIVVADEGMGSSKEIANRLEEEKDLAAIPGTCVFHDHETVMTPSGPPLPLDEFPLPDRSLTKVYRKYYSMWKFSLASIRTSTGCPFRCSFCAQWKLNGGRYFVRDPNEVLKELAQVEEDYIIITDDEAMADTQRMARMADLIGTHGIRKRYFAYVRSDTIVKHPTLMEKWRRIGLDMVFIGLESMVQEELNGFNKSVSVGQNEQALKIMKDLDVVVFPNFIVLPQYTMKDFRNLASRVRRLKLPYASFFVLTPALGTDFYTEVQGQLLTDHLGLYDRQHPE